MSLILDDLPSLLDLTARQAEAVAADVRVAVAGRVAPGGRLGRAALDAEQHAAHGLARVGSYVETLRQTAAWARALEAQGRFGEAEALPAQLLAYEYASQLLGGVPMNQGETFRTWDVGVPSLSMGPIVSRLAPGASQAVKDRIV